MGLFLRVDSRLQFIFSLFVTTALTLTFLAMTASHAYAAADDATGSGGTGSGGDPGGDYYGGGTMCGFSEGSGFDFGPCGPGESCVPFAIAGGLTGGICQPCTDGSCGCTETQFACGSTCCSSGDTCFNGKCGGGSSSSTSSSSSDSSSSSSSSDSSSSSSSSSDSSTSSSSSSSDSSSSSSSSFSSSSSSSSSTSSSSSSSSSSVGSSSSSSSSSSSVQSSSSSSSSTTSSSSSSNSSSSSSSSSSVPLPPGCDEKVLINDKAVLDLGPKLLKNYADVTLKRLIRTSKSTSVKKTLKSDAKRSEKKLTFFIHEAEVSLQQLPDIMVVCVDEQYCAAADNSQAIDQHIRAIIKLRNQVTRTLNRATRLVYLSPADARKQTDKFGKKVRKYGKDLLKAAQALPRTHHNCT